MINWQTSFIAVKCQIIELLTNPYVIFLKKKILSTAAYFYSYKLSFTLLLRFFSLIARFYP